MAKRLMKWIPALLILSLSLSLSYYWLTNKPQAKKKQAQQVAPLVTVIKVNKVDYATTVNAMGSIIPAQKVNLTSRINGMIISVSPNFIPGGFLARPKKNLI